MAQTRQLTGTVKDAKTNTPLASVTVSVEGKKITTITNADGNFTLNIPTGNVTLQLSYVNYAVKTVTVSESDNNLNIALEELTANLNEVVVTALGLTKQARKVGYAITTVSGEQLNKARETNVALSLAGQVAGLTVHGTSGGPGSTARILLRGMPSINSGGAPLFVINGVPIDNSNRGSAGEWGGSDNGDGIQNINPDDIETLTILKGQAASALYGARASNGVILITTKSGKKGSATVEYNMNYQVDKSYDLTDFQYVYGQGQNGAKPANQTEAQNTARLSWGGKLDGSSFTQFDGKQYSYSPYTDNIKNFYRTAPTFTNSVSVSGGGDKGTYRLSLSNMSNESVIRNSGIDRKTVNFNFDQKVTDKISVALNTNYLVQSDKNRPQLSDGPGNPNNGTFLANNINEDILAPGYDSTGKEIVFSDDIYVTNPWFAVNRWVNNIDRKRLIASIAPKYYFTPWLYVMGRLGYDHIQDRYFNVTPSGTAYSINNAGKSGSINVRSAEISELNLDGLIGITHALTSNLNLDATLGGNIRKNRYESISENGGPFVIDNLYTPKNVVNYGRDYDFNSKEVHSGFYTVDLTYKNYLTLNTTGRYDAYSTLYNSSIPKSERNIFTPSVSGSFLFSQLAHIKSLDYGKLRLSYAQTSNEPSFPYQTAVYYGVGNSINGVATGNYSSTLPNLFLKPFVLTEIEAGIELRLFKNRLGFDIAWYTRKTKNEIMNGNLSMATGFSSYVVGTGSAKNTGVEIQVTGRPVETKSFIWNVTFNATTVRSKILHTDAANNPVSLGTYRPLNAGTAFVVGMSGPQIRAYDYVYDDKGNIVVDASGLPERAGSYSTYGSVLPTFYGGLNNDFSYKNFGFSFLIDYNYGNKILSATKFYAVYRGLDKSTLIGRETGIVVSGVNEDGSANTTSVSAQNYYQRLASISKFNVLDGDYIKVRQVTIGYTIPEKIFAGIPVIRSVQLSLVARNLLIIMKKSDNIDPEAQFAASINYAGIEGTSLPSTRTFGINANVKFK